MGITLGLLVWGYKMNPSFSNVTLCLSILFLVLTVWLLPWMQEQHLIIRWVWTIGALCVLSLIGYYAFWTPAPEPTPIVESKPKYSTIVVVQYPDLSEHSNEFPAGLKRSFDLDGAGVVHVVGGTKKEVLLGLGQAFSDPAFRERELPGGKFKYGGFMRVDGPSEWLRYGHKEPLRVAGNGRRFLLSLVSISVEPRGNDVGIIEYQIAVKEI